MGLRLRMKHLSVCPEFYLDLMSQGERPERAQRHGQPSLWVSEGVW